MLRKNTLLFLIFGFSCLAFGMSSEKSSYTNAFPFKKITDVTFDNYVGEIPIELQSILLSLREPQRVKEKNLVIPKKILVYGPWGNGKKTLVKALAHATGFNYCEVSGPGCDAQGVDYIEALFKKARAIPNSIVAIDELELINSKSNGLLTPQGALARELRNKENSNLFIFCIAHDYHLAEEFCKHKTFDTTIATEFPTDEEKEKILELFLRTTNNSLLDQSGSTKKTPAFYALLNKIKASEKGFTGGDIKQLVSRAKAKAFMENKSIVDADHFDEAYASVAKMVVLLNRTLD